MEYNSVEPLDCELVRWIVKIQNNPLLSSTTTESESKENLKFHLSNLKGLQLEILDKIFSLDYSLKVHQALKDLNLKIKAKIIQCNEKLHLIDLIQEKDCSSEFDRNYPHSEKMFQVLYQQFKINKFRSNQLQAINAACLGHDCFILMPTGGGKSLCYQLPALLTTGVTIVVSPLRSLIKDQVRNLKELNIATTHCLSDQKHEELKMLSMDLSKDQPDCKIIYITPEGLPSQKSQARLKTLHEKRLLARFVIDEAHCVSHWGHDFRPEYTNLHSLRSKYPGVPIMALTASATPRVKAEIVQQLSMSSTKWFMSGFNRPNLRYNIREKKGSGEYQITEFIKNNNYEKACGIVYCLSREDCETVAEYLMNWGINAHHYHAGMEDHNRDKVQKQWSNEEINLVCATTAFGMGIDKANVRYVIHHTMPQSIEAFYQETGRAGRDGEPADCVLFYTSDDMPRLTRLIRFKIMNQIALNHRLENLAKMQKFCQNKSDCRRVLQLNHFGESFERVNCIQNSKTTCDNCERCKEKIEHVDFSEHSKDITKMVQGISKRGVDVPSIIDSVYLASRYIKKIKPSTARFVTTEENNFIQSLIQKMILMKILKESFYEHNEIMCSSVELGPKAHELMTSTNLKVFMEVRKDKPRSWLIINTIAANVTREIKNPLVLGFLKNLKQGDFHYELYQRGQEALACNQPPLKTLTTDKNSNHITSSGGPPLKKQK